MNKIVKIALIVGAALFLVALIWAIIVLDGMTRWVLIIGVVVVVFIFVIFLAILGWMNKRKAAPFERELAGSAAAVPTGVSEASSRARLDELRQKFLQGVETFKTHGKDIYSLPWYAIVGEPGSGKTECLRHSNVGFPPGLQDELQGSGGTLNMDWWFTNHAIILDTAGRLMFDESESSSNSEWIEFLKLLRKNRPNCPINGLMLVIPVDSIIRDSANQIQEKGGRIARQLDLIQRTLGVRFPVFILLTKADLINGFREFFDELTDPQLQHQMLGWSNPGDLDDEFNPEDVVDHIYTVQERLERRRLGLLLDPVSREGAMDRRINEVDAMFAFPESLANITPRLRRYLELIFVSGEWSSKPLFLRGIYFVSSMREGSALDSDLADALGVPVDDLPEGRVWERDRSYFLRDLFIEKMFREWGLVTRTSNTAQLKRTRGVTVYGTAIVALLVILGMSIWQYQSLRTRIGRPSDFWAAASAVFAEPDGADEGIPEIVRSTDGEPKYHGGSTVDFENRLDVDDEDRVVTDVDSVTIVDAMGEIGRQIDKEISAPLIFKPIAGFVGESGNMLREERMEAGRAVFELSVLRPILQRALASMEGSATSRWTEEASAALPELLKIYALNDPNLEPATRINLKPIFNYALRAGAAAGVTPEPVPDAHMDVIQEAFAALYRPAEDDQRWPARVLAAGGEPEQQLAKGVAGFTSHIRSEGQAGGGGAMARAQQVLQALRAFKTAEDAILGAYAPVDGEALHPDLTAWDQFYGDLGIESASGPYQVIEANLSQFEASGFAEWYETTVNTERQQITNNFNTLFDNLPPADDIAVAEGNSTVRGRLVQFRQTLEQEQIEITAMLDQGGGDTASPRSLNRELLEAQGDAGELKFRRRARIYKAIETLRADPRSAADLVALSSSINAFDQDLDTARSMFAGLRTSVVADRINRSVVAGDQLLTMVRGDEVKQLIGIAIDQSRSLGSSEDIADLVEQVVASEDRYQPKPAPQLEMTIWWGDGAAGELATRYHPEAGPACLTMLRDIEDYQRTRHPDGAAADALEALRHQYVEKYIDYWRAPLDNEDLYRSYGNDWEAFWRDLDFGFDSLNEALRQFAERTRKPALQALSASDDWPDSLSTHHMQALEWVGEDVAALSPGNRFFSTQCQAWWDSWRTRRSTDFTAVRRDMLSMEQNQFRQGPLRLYGLGSADGHYVDFWRQLTNVGLATLAGASEDETRSAAATLADLRQWFPLNRLHADAQLAQLGSDDSEQNRQLLFPMVLSAREALKKIKPTSGEGGGGDFGDGRIGNAETRFDHPAIDGPLDRLRGKRLEEVERAELVELERLLSALPPDLDARVPTCKVTYVGNRSPSPGRAAIYNSLPNLQVKQSVDGRVDRTPHHLGVGVMPLFEEQYPGASQLVLEFSAIQGEMVRHTLTINGPWALFALLHKYNGQRMADKTTNWMVEIPVPFMSEGRAIELSFWLELEFETVLPRLRDWP